MDPDGCSGDARRLAQERDLALVALDQMHAFDAEDGEDEAGQAGAAAKIDQRSQRWRQMRVDLGRIEDVTAPDIGEGPNPDQIDGALPANEQIDVATQPRQCFT
jgi:hypothetical protein